MPSRPGGRACARYDFTPDSKFILVQRIQDGSMSLWQIGLETGQEKQICPGGLSQPEPGGGVAGWREGGADRLGRQPATAGHHPRALRAGAGRAAAPPPRSCRWLLFAGTAYALAGGSRRSGIWLVYPAVQPWLRRVGLPPLVVMVHGGPTGQRLLGFDIGVQFFTSRGYAVLNVNYRGSTGYGRAYRDLLLGNWGVYDVQDAISGARHLVEQGLGGWRAAGDHGRQCRRLYRAQGSGGRSRLLQGGHLPVWHLEPVHCWRLKRINSKRITTTA